MNYSAPSSHTNNQCVTIDLEKTYDLDEVAVWNYFGDPRSYYNNKTYVSKDNSNWNEILNEASIETSNGHRINAYTNTYNGYVSEDWFYGMMVLLILVLIEIILLVLGKIWQILVTVVHLKTVQLGMEIIYHLMEQTIHQKQINQ